MKTITLRHYITRRHNVNHLWQDMPEDMQLSEDDCKEIADLFNCWGKNKTFFASLLNNADLSTMDPHGIYDRIYKDGHGWQYCAGQCYPSEIVFIRKLLKKELN